MVVWSCRQYLGKRYRLDTNPEWLVSSSLQVILLDLGLDVKWYRHHHLRDHEMISLDIFTICWCAKFLVEATIADHKVQHIFIQSPFLQTTLWTKKGRTILQLAAESVTNPQGLRPFYTANWSAISTILRTYQAEMTGSPKMTIDDMNWAIEAYLYRRGFRIKDDLSQLKNSEVPWYEAYGCYAIRVRDQKDQNNHQRRVCLSKINSVR